MLNSILNETATNITAFHIAACTASSILLGILLAAIHTYKNRSSRSFFLTLILLPVIVQMIIMMVNGNLGTGVAVMGAFSLVRFRSLPGNSREISSIFLGMAVGLANGMGYIGIAFLLIAVVGVMTVLVLSLPEFDQSRSRKQLKVTVPENLNYNGIFEDIFLKYTNRAKLIRVRTVNMGSLYELNYDIELRKQEEEKKMLDEIRCRNGNLTIVCGHIPEGEEHL